MSDFRDDMREWRHRKWKKRLQMWTCWKCSRKTDGKLCRIGLEDCPAVEEQKMRDAVGHD